jgi:hypothetical protein
MKVGEDRVGEKAGGDFNKLGMGKGSAEVVVGQVNGPEEVDPVHEGKNLKNRETIFF